MNKIMTPPRLWLGQVSEAFDPRSDAVIGPWCFQGAEDAFDGWTATDFSTRFEAADEVVGAAAKVRELANSMVPELAKTFNDRHGVAYGLDYWRILLMPWLIFVIPAVYRRYTDIADFIAKHGDRDFIVPVCETRPELTLSGVRDIWSEALLAHHFNFWLNSEIVLALRPEKWQLAPSPIVNAGEPTHAAATQPQRFAGIIDRLRCRHVPGMGYWAIAFSAYLSVLPRKVQHAEFKYPKPELAEGRFPRPFLEIMRKVLNRLEPETLGHAFPAFDGEARARRYRKGKINLVGPVMMLNEAEKFRLAHAREAGELIVCSQHGGQGYQRLPLPLVETEYQQDAYLTWGWTAQDTHVGQFVPVPSPLFSRWTGRHRDQTGSLYLVSTEVQPFSCRLQTTDLQGPYCIENRDQKRAFLRALSGPIRDAVIYRPYPANQGGLKDAPYLTEETPDLEVVEGEMRHSEFCRRLTSSRLLVTDHPVTSFSFGLAANVPTVGFWNAKAWPRATQSDEIFESLADAGIIRFSATDAAAHVNAIWDDVGAWWRQENVQQARRRFCKAYAHTDDRWWLHWAQALWRL